MLEKLPITSIDVYRVEKEIRAPYRLSYGSITNFFATVYRVHAGDCSGLGEAIVTDHDLAIRLAKGLIGKDARDPSTAFAHFDVTEFTQRACREALSFAMADLVGKTDGTPLWASLGDTVRDTFPLRPVVFIQDPGEMARAVGDLLAHGFTAVKIKLSGNAEDDLRSLQSVRNACGDSFDLQADANYGYADAESFLGMLARCPPGTLNIIEDPSELTFREYAQLREALAPFQTSLMLDASARTPDQVEAICEIGAADIVNHHPNCIGGPDLLMRYQERTRDAGLRNAIGGATGYFGIADVCYYSAAPTIGSGPVEQTPTEMYQGTRVSPNPHSRNGGMLRVNRGTVGTGAELDEGALASVLVSYTRLRGGWRRFFPGW